MGGNATFDDVKPFIAGGVAGMMSWYVTYPIDCIKTRIQATDLNSSEKPKIHKVIQQIHREGDMINDMMLRSAGMKATLIRAFICNSVTFGTVALVLKVYDTIGKDSL